MLVFPVESEEYTPPGSPPGRSQYIDKKVEQVLDKAYGNPAIYRYSSSNVAKSAQSLDQYMDIGHGYSYDRKGNAPIKSELWLMDNRYNIESVPQKNGNTHNSIFGDKIFDSIARGRYDEYASGEKNASMTLDYGVYELSPQRQKYIEKKVERALSKYYDNPRIHRY